MKKCLIDLKKIVFFLGMDYLRCLLEGRQIKMNAGAAALRFYFHSLLKTSFQRS